MNGRMSWLGSQGRTALIERSFCPKMGKRSCPAQSGLSPTSAGEHVPVQDFAIGSRKVKELAVDCSLMPRYRIHRIKQAPLEIFRWTAHTGGLAVVKPKDYDLDEEIESATPYSAWKTLAVEGKALRLGDLLECPAEDARPASLLIAKYIGFEPADWFVPEPKPEKIWISSGDPEAQHDPVFQNS